MELVSSGILATAPFSHLRMMVEAFKHETILMIDTNGKLVKTCFPDICTVPPVTFGDRPI
jgi:hypothetical protein